VSDGIGGRPPADWYADPDHPENPLAVRYWNGSAWTEHRATMQPAQPAAQQPQAGPPVALGGPLLTVASHEFGRNATVHLYADRIERTQSPLFGFLSKGEVPEVIPVRAVTKVTSRKDGSRHSIVSVSMATSVTTFKLAHSDAERFQAALQSLQPSAFPSAGTEFTRLVKKWWPAALAAVVVVGLIGVASGASENKDKAEAVATTTTQATTTTTTRANRTPTTTTTRPTTTTTSTTAPPTTTTAPPTTTTAPPMTAPPPPPVTAAPAPPVTAPPSAYYANCDAVRAAGADPLYRGQPGYRSELDRDHDGVACE
jgi:hypothetical protein